MHSGVIPQGPCRLAVMKKAKRLTKKERKAAQGGPTLQANAPHIHCVACGRHMDPGDFTQVPIVGNWVKCAHGTRYAACSRCVPEAMRRLAEHDRTGKAVQVAAAWH